MSDLPAIDAGKSWWAGLADVHKTNPSEHMEQDALGAYCWIAVPAASEADALAAMKAAAKTEGLMVEDVEDLQKFASMAELRDLDDNLADSVAKLTAGEAAAWGTLNLYTAEEEAA